MRYSQAVVYYGSNCKAPQPYSPRGFVPRVRARPVCQFPMDSHSNNPFLAQTREPSDVFADLAGLDLNTGEAQPQPAAQPASQAPALAPVNTAQTTAFSSPSIESPQSPGALSQSKNPFFQQVAPEPINTESQYVQYNTVTDAPVAPPVTSPVMLAPPATGPSNSVGAAPPLTDTNWAPASSRNYATTSAFASPAVSQSAFAPVASEPVAASTDADEQLAKSLALPADDSTQWQLREIEWRNSIRKSILQNENGPCSLIALCNALLLQGRFSITPDDRPAVSYSYISERIADIVLDGNGRAQNNDPTILSSALAALPKMTRGFAVDVSFSGPTSFVGESGGGELSLFALAGVPLVHGWLPDPADPTTFAAVKRSGTYNTTALTVAQSQSMPTPSDEARILNNFLIDSATQLTPAGIKALREAVPPGQLAVLFRNSHLSVLYHRLPIEGTPDAPELFTLVTDEAFAMEDSIVWESLTDVDGSMTHYYNGRFEPVDVRDRDWVRQTRPDENEDAEYVLYHADQLCACAPSAERRASSCTCCYRCPSFSPRGSVRW